MFGRQNMTQRSGIHSVQIRAVNCALDLSKTTIQPRHKSEASYIFWIERLAIYRTIRLEGDKARSELFYAMAEMVDWGSRLHDYAL